jgi:predicted nucleic acid-binding protein
LEQKLLRLMLDFSDRILLIDAEIADAWGYMIAQKELNVYDLSVAATAKIKNYTVVTRNLRDFIGRGVRLLDPYKEPPDIREVS